MKSIFVALALVAVVVLSSCSTSYYPARRTSPYRYNGNSHVDYNRGYNNGHNNVYGGNSHGRISTGHGRW